MTYNKAIFIIPGFRQSSKNKAYRQIAKKLKAEGFTPIPINIPWKNTTISENTMYFLDKYKATKATKKYILGFSYGAMIAFIAGAQVTPQGLILCSLSPYFNEDISKLKRKALGSLSEKRYQDFINLKSEVLAKKIKAKKILMLYGKLEAKTLVKRVVLTFDQITSPQKKLMPILNTHHEIGSKRYLESISQAVKTLL